MKYIHFFSVLTLKSSFLIILPYNFNNSSLLFNQLIFSNISFLIFFSLFKKVLVSLCKPSLSKPLGSYLFLVSLCKPSLSKPSLLKPSKLYFVPVSLCKPPSSKPSLSKLYFSVSSGSTLNSVFLTFPYIFNFSGFFFLNIYCMRKFIVSIIHLYFYIFSFLF